jgi:hypothetical protein
MQVEALRSRWQMLDRGARVAIVGLAILLAGAIAVRVWLMVVYPPAFLGFPDSSQYALAAALNIFRDAQRPAGYPLFLRLVHHISGHVSFTIAVQHTLGVANGLLLYKAVRRTGAPPWLGLLPAAVVFFEGTGLLLEHALLADPLFAFLLAVNVYATVRALDGPSLRWPLLVGVATGVAFWVKTAAVANAVLVAVMLLFLAPGGFRRRLLSSFTVSILVAALIVTYVGFQYYFTGYLGYERQSAWDLYGRVASFVDCSELTPPRGTAFLCPHEPLSKRGWPGYFQDAHTSPAVQAFGPPYAAPPTANGVLEKFNEAVIEQEPLRYAGAILRGLSRYLFPRGGEGYGPPGVREEVTSPSNERQFAGAFALFYPKTLGYISPDPSVHPLADYERYTLLQGPLLVFLLAAGLIGPFFLQGRLRWASAFFTLTALASITFAVAGNSYDPRYAYPTLGPLAAGGALGAWGIATWSAASLRRRRARRASVPAAATPP